MLVDYEGPLARRVAGDLWAGISRAALDSGAGHIKTTALWDSLREPSGTSEESAVRVFVMEQDLPEAVEALRAAETEMLHGLVLAVPERPSPLAGSLLYQGVERLKECGVKVGSIEPALLHANPGECERYAGKLIERLKIQR
ncbi:MAG: hypothetical protein L0G70_07915 [Rubrobacter sp.]|nr:hypothetical protein [Rubrobacter sp.]